jgi:hypothetical protein
MRPVGHIECGPNAVDGSPDRIKAVSDAENPVLGSWRNAPNVVPNVR